MIAEVAVVELIEVTTEDATVMLGETDRVVVEGLESTAVIAGPKVIAVTDRQLSTVDTTGGSPTVTLLRR